MTLAFAYRRRQRVDAMAGVTTQTHVQSGSVGSPCLTYGGRSDLIAVSGFHSGFASAHLLRDDVAED